MFFKILQILKQKSQFQEFKILSNIYVFFKSGFIMIQSNETRQTYYLDKGNIGLNRISKTNLINYLKNLEVIN